MSELRLKLEDLISLIEGPDGSACAQILADNKQLFQRAPGSGYNHQAWPGGYWDHITEVMNIAVLLHKTLSAQRPLPFSLSDSLLVLFLHDLEKPWRFLNRDMASKQSRKEFREKKLREYGISLTPEQANAFKYVEGEGDDYSPKGRVMNELAGFCHMCDVASARVWPEMPAKSSDPWSGAGRIADKEVS